MIVQQIQYVNKRLKYIGNQTHGAIWLRKFLWQFSVSYTRYASWLLITADQSEEKSLEPLRILLSGPQPNLLKINMIELQKRPWKRKQEQQPSSKWQCTKNEI